METIHLHCLFVQVIEVLGLDDGVFSEALGAKNFHLLYGLHAVVTLPPIVVVEAPQVIVSSARKQHESSALFAFEAALFISKADILPLELVFQPLLAIDSLLVFRTAF